MESNDAETSGGEPRKRAPKGLLPRNRDALDAYLQDIKGARTLSMAEEAALAARIRTGDARALNELVQANLKFVVAVCRNYRFQGLSMGDLINEGNLGLMRAAQRFDGTLNIKFISYAVWWIRQTILTAMAEQSRILRLSTGKVGSITRIGKASRRLEQKLGRAPSMEEVAAEMQLTEFEISECLQLAEAPVSLTRPLQEDGEGALEDVLEDKDGDRPDKGIRHALIGKNLAEVLATLDEQEAEVLKLYYGLGRESTESMDEIALRYGVTRERVRQIKVKALERLRHPTRMDKLDRFQD